jgi:hypothetical protein
MQRYLIVLVLFLGLSLAGCKKQEPAQPDADVVAAIYTEAVATLNAGATQTAAFATPTFTETATPTATMTPTFTPAVAFVTNTIVYSGGTNLSQCDMAGFVADVTIPDGSIVAAGQTFTKTWRIKNDGTCTWTPNYKIVYYSGEKLNTNNNYPLTTTNVAPGETLEISIQMTAPTAPGSYISNWLLQNATGQYFGIGSSGGVIYVQFVVSGTPGAPTATATAQASQTTAPPTATNTPEPSPTATQAKDGDS